MNEIIISGPAAPGQQWWSAEVACPGTNEHTQDIFCPKRDACELPEVFVKADSSAEARELIEIAGAIGDMPYRCLNNRPYFLPGSSSRFRIQPTIDPNDL